MGKPGRLSEIKYKLLHSSHPKWFIGRMDGETAEDIADCVHSVNALRLLDYGCGKGSQYLIQRVHEFWGGILPHCYDPGVLWLSVRPTGPFDGIICTDVLEHVQENELDDVLADIFGLLIPGGFVYFKISTVPAKKVDDNGNNLHLTIMPEEWWREKLAPYTNHHLVVIKCTQ